MTSNEVIISLIVGIVSGLVSGYLVFILTSTPQLFAAVDSSHEYLNQTNTTGYTLKL